MDESLLPKELQTKDINTGQQKIKAVAKATVKKPNTRDKLRDVVFNADIGDVGEYIVYEEIIPRLINALIDTIKNTLDMAFAGQRSRDRRRHRGSSNATYSFDIEREDDDRIPARSRRDRDDMARRSDRLIPLSFGSMREAQAVLDEMVEFLTVYDQVTVADYYNAAEVSPNATDNKWGWTSLKSAIVTKDRDGWYIDLPRPKAL